MYCNSATCGLVSTATKMCSCCVLSDGKNQGSQLIKHFFLSLCMPSLMSKWGRVCPLSLWGEQVVLHVLGYISEVQSHSHTCGFGR